MYTIVVADDEEELRKAIIKKIQWEEIGFQVVGEAENGVEALELVEKMEPDLLLSDIRMPFISGIELARQVREIRPSTQIAFLSGYDEFSYAQQAIQYNIISYLLKPISMVELTKELTNMKVKIDKLFLEFASKQRTDMDLSSFLMPLLLDEYHTDNTEERELRLGRNAVDTGFLTTVEPSLRYVVLVTTILDGHGVNQTDHNHVSSIDIILRKYIRYYSFYCGGKIVSLMAGTSAAFEKYLHILVDDIMQSMERILGMHCNIGISRVVLLLSACHEAYTEAVSAMRYARHTDSSVHYITDEEPFRGMDPDDISNVISEIENRIRTSTREELEVYLDEILGGLERHGATKGQVNFLVTELVVSVSRAVCAVVDGEEAERFKQEGDMHRMAFLECRIPEIIGLFTSYCLNAREIIFDQRKKSGEVLCKKALYLIETDYMNTDISLVSVSGQIGISPNYLSALLKKHIGKTFIDLLTQKRIETAKALIMDTPMKIREISERCGYSDQHYFSYCFKKYIGMSPNMLRQQNRGTEVS